ncbi:aspartate-semialdehyde dehydrogenase [Candidatus Pelagibacter sp.]|jgi:aspartate-semialdehyde dehydrogenase|nr:aspartate-semialdehyde dehydrogenase [Candidatus Pelagibacter sp.]
MNIAIVGATGNVGRKIIEVLERKKISIDNLYLIASSKSVGVKIKFKGKEHRVFDLENFDFSKARITFFAAGGKISEKFAEKAAKDSIVIDNSSFFRMDPDVPLIVPQVNPNDLKNLKKNIIANPNCSTAQLVIALKPLHDFFEIKRVVVSTYQSVSGGGKAPMDELIDQSQKFLENYLTPETGLHNMESKNFTKQIAFNAIPHIDVFSDDGYTKEELKMVYETKKILDEKIDLTATCVRIPVLVSHSESVNIQFEKPFSLEKVSKALDNFEGCKVIDERSDGGYFTAVEAEGKDETFICRIREDKTIKNGLNLWIVSDNLLRGAALNAVEIAEILIKNNFYGK